MHQVKLAATTVLAMLLLAAGASAATVSVGAVPTDGSTLAYAGDTTNDGFDVYNFVLPFDISGDVGDFLHMETGNANYDTYIFLYSGFNAPGYPPSGGELDSDDDSSGGTFGSCPELGVGSGYSLCSSIGAGDDPLARTGGTVLGLPLLAGNYSLVVEGFGDAVGTYELHITAQNAVSEVPLPAAGALFPAGLGVLGLFGWRGRGKARAT